MSWGRKISEGFGGTEDEEMGKRRERKVEENISRRKTGVEVIERSDLRDQIQIIAAET